MLRDYVDLNVYCEKWSPDHGQWRSVHRWRHRADGSAYVTHPPYQLVEDDYRESLIAVLSRRHPEWLVAGRDALPVIDGVPDSVDLPTAAACDEASFCTWVTSEEAAQYPWLKPVTSIAPASTRERMWYEATGVLPQAAAFDEPKSDEVLIELTPMDLWGACWITQTLEFIQRAAETQSRLVFAFTYRGRYAPT